jgi:B9 domain-containing protein 1
MPFECSLRSTNPYGWPQLVVTCAYPDFLGREVIKGYGVCHIPTTPGRYYLLI